MALNPTLNKYKYPIRKRGESFILERKHIDFELRNVENYRFDVLKGKG